MININIKNLQSEVEERERRKFKTYDKILESCYSKILTTNQKTNDCCCIYTCPPIIFGLPLYNVTECVKYIMEKLSKKGFKVYFTNPNIVFISWKTETSEVDVKYDDNDDAHNYFKKQTANVKLIDNFKQRQLQYEPTRYDIERNEGGGYQRDQAPRKNDYLYKRSLMNDELLPPPRTSSRQQETQSNNYDRRDIATNSNLREKKSYRPISDYSENELFSSNKNDDMIEIDLFT